MKSKLIHSLVVKITRVNHSSQG